MTLAKGLGGGMPIGACLAKEAVAAVFTAGTHASTFGGNPLACAAGLATLDAIEQEKLRENAEAIGNFICDSLRQAFSGNNDWPEQWRSPEPKAAYDAVIIGGGGHGLSTAYYLAKEHGITNVAVLEKGYLCAGASGRNGGQAIHGLACDQSVIEAQLGHDDSKRVWDMTLEAIRLIGRSIRGAFSNGNDVAARVLAGILGRGRPRRAPKFGAIRERARADPLAARKP